MKQQELEEIIRIKKKAIELLSYFSYNATRLLPIDHKEQIEKLLEDDIVLEKSINLSPSCAE